MDNEKSDYKVKKATRQKQKQQRSFSSSLNKILTCLFKFFLKHFYAKEIKRKTGEVPKKSNVCIIGECTCEFNRQFNRELNMKFNLKQIQSFTPLYTVV